MSKYVIASVGLVALILFQVFAAGQNGGKRCEFGDPELHRVRRYALSNVAHSKLDLTYKISEYSKNLSRADVDVTLKKAFDVWTDHVDFTFTQLDSDSNEKPDIDIRFVVRDNRRGVPFDGPGGTLAEAGKTSLHFDDEETWKINSEDGGINLFSVAVHEIGHTLGLAHSDVVEAIMYPYYDNATKLHEDDVLGIQEIYKKKKDRSKFNLNLCKDPQFDTIFKTIKGKVLIFKGDVYYELKKRYIVKGPKKITDIWKELPADIDAAYSLGRETYFFKHGLYWRYDGTKLDEQSPEKINGYSRELPVYVDSVMVGEDNKIYFFKGSNYYRVDKFHHGSMNVEVGKIAEKFKGIPNDISAAFYNKYFKRTYFFKNKTFYFYNDTIKVRKIRTTSFFLNCKNKLKNNFGKLQVSKPSFS